jgi:hypothetical protein
MIELHRAMNGVHKWYVRFDNGKRVHFGRQGYSDYTIHKDRHRMSRYLVRHASRENWKTSGKFTPGFWSRWVLWSKPSLQQAVRQTEKVLGEKIVVKR